MPAAGTAHRVVYRYAVQDVICLTRQVFVNDAIYADDLIASRMSQLMNIIGAQFIKMLASDCRLLDMFGDLPDRPEVFPTVLSGDATGTRLGASLPATVYHQIHWLAPRGGGARSLRNTMKISGVSQVDHRANHMIVNLDATKVLFRDFILAGVTATSVNFLPACYKKTIPPSGPPVIEKLVATFANMPTQMHVLKSRQS